MVDKIYIVGNYLGQTWELLGVFTDEKDAIKACSLRTHFVGPVDLNVRLPDEQIKWPGCYYPKTGGD